MSHYPRTTSLFGAILVSLAACGTGGQSSGTASAPAPKQPSRVDAVFTGQATTRDIALIDSARLAQTKTTDSAIRDLATHIVQDRSGVDHQVAALAQSQGWSLPAAMDAPHQQQLAQLESLNGPAFNRAWLDQQLRDQTMAIQAFQAEADTSTDPPFRDLAQAALPGMLEDLRATQQLSIAR